MDRSSGKAIAGYAGIWIITTAIFFMAVFCIIWEEEQKDQARIKEMLALHPELETDIIELYIKGFNQEGWEIQDRADSVLENKYGYSFYERVFDSKIWYLCIIFLILEAVLLYLSRNNRQSYNNALRMQMGQIAEQLDEFQKGKFSFKRDDMDQETGGKMGGCQNTIVTIWEKLKELGMYFESLKERLEEEENSTKALITDISHQLKTPLASLRISHELVLAEDLTTEERKEFLGQEEGEIRRLETLLDELVELSRLENSMIQIKPESANIGQTLTEAVNRIYMKAHEKQIEIRLEKERQLENRVILVWHDRKWTVEAIANILENAVKYSERQTHIVLRLIEMPVNLLIEVEDEGIGIPKKELHRIYQRFYRGEEAQKLVRDGAGVGLYLARSIIEKQGGTITAKRRQKQGMIFRITLPINR